jgi:hypothetical protein
MAITAPLSGKKLFSSICIMEAQMQPTYGQRSNSYTSHQSKIFDRYGNPSSNRNIAPPDFHRNVSTGCSRYLLKSSALVLLRFIIVWVYFFVGESNSFGTGLTSDALFMTTFMMALGVTPKSFSKAMTSLTLKLPVLNSFFTNRP